MFTVPAQGNGVVDITNLRLDAQQAGPTTNIEEMSFDVSIEISALNGLPIYGPKGNTTPPKPIHTPNPEYTKEARQAHYEGVLVLQLVVATDGTTKDIKATRPLQYGLTEKGIDAVKKWRFKPATKDGQPVSLQITVQVDFHIYR